MSVKLTKLQQALLERIKDGQLLKAYYPPGSDGPHRWYVQNPYSDEDGRTAWSLVNRKLVAYEGDGDFLITPAGREALSKGEKGS